MTKKQSVFLTKFFILVSFITMIVVNALANILPINDITTGEVSDAYPNLFAPAGITFSIWGVIYLLLGIYVVYQVFLTKKFDCVNQKVGLLFIASSIANAVWIFMWHYDYIFLSVILMLCILVCLILIHKTLSHAQLTKSEALTLKLPFSVYFGWITIATIANITTFLVAINWNGFGISDEIWTVLILIVGIIICTTVVLKNSDIAYGLVAIWAYTGILIKHLSANGFDSQYPAIIVTVSLCILLMVFAVIKTAIKIKKVK